MAIQRSEEDLLNRLRTNHLRGGKHAFVTDLADIRASRIAHRHQEIFKTMMSDARGLGMEKHPKVRLTRRHIARERMRILKRGRWKPTSVATPGGHAMRV